MVMFGCLEHSSLHVDAEGIMEWLSGAEEETGGPLALRTGRGEGLG